MEICKKKKLLLLIIGIPTFFMPLAYLIMVIWAFGGMIFNYDLDMPAWMLYFLEPAYYITLILLPMYAAWVLLSKKISGAEKFKWILIIIFLNMIGMPMFYVFIVRKYLGIKLKFNNKDEKALSKFLKLNFINPDNLSSQQNRVLLTYCQKKRQYKIYGFLYMIFGILIIYLSLTYFLSHGIKAFPDALLTKTIIINSSNNTTNVFCPSSFERAESIRFLLYIGALIGMVFFSGLLFIGMGFRNLFFFDNQQKMLIDFLKAKK